MSGLRQAALLVRLSVRSTSWAPLAAGGALALVLLALGDPGLARLRLAAIALCLGAAFALDDAAAATVASAPTPLWARRALRLALALIPLAGLWALAWWLSEGAASWALSLELGAMLALTLAAAGLAARIRGDGRGGVAAGPALLVLLAGAYLLLPARLGLFPDARRTLSGRRRTSAGPSSSPRPWSACSSPAATPPALLSSPGFVAQRHGYLRSRRSKIRYTHTM